MLARSIAATAALTLALAGAADAKGKKGDADGDGLKDKLELAAGLDPRSADSDGDGVKDGREGHGEVVKVRGDWVTIKLLGGEAVRARLTDDTKLTCVVPEEDEDEAGLEDEDVLEGEADDAPVEEVVGEATEDDALLDDEELDDEEEACTADDLAKGVTVLASASKGKAKKARWTRLELEV